MATAPKPDLLLYTENAARVNRSLDKKMRDLSRKDTDEDSAEAERIAKVLLKNADLTLFLPARACVILGSSSSPGYVEWAREGVRTVQLGIEAVRRDGRELGDLEKRVA